MGPGVKVDLEAILSPRIVEPEEHINFKLGQANGDRLGRHRRYSHLQTFSARKCSPELHRSRSCDIRHQDRTEAKREQKAEHRWSGISLPDFRPRNQMLCMSDARKTDCGHVPVPLRAGLTPRLQLDQADERYPAGFHPR